MDDPTQEIDIHRADGDEKRRAYEQAYETWGEGSRAAWVQNRMESRQHNRADWWVGMRDGEVVCSLGAYPLLCRLDGELVSGVGLGAVHTAPDARGEGYGSRLCGHVMSESQQQGDRVALLYTDIDPAFYEQMGFEIAERFVWSCDDLRAVAGAVERTTHAYPIDTEVDAGRLREMYAEAHAGRSLYVDRDETYWSYLEQLHPDDEVVVVESGIGEVLMYARLRSEEDGAGVVATECPCLGEAPADWAAGMAGLAELLVDQQVHALRFGAEPRGMSKALFDRQVRGDAMPMVAALGDDFSFDVRRDAEIWATDKF